MQVQQRHDADMDKVFVAPLVIRGMVSILSAVRLVWAMVNSTITHN
jgi:hypothetical protein